MVLRNFLRMGRDKRHDEPGAWHHVMNQGTAKCDIFRSDADRRVFVGLLSELHIRFGLRVHAFVLMGNHYHLLVRSERGELADAMHWLGTNYARYFNQRHSRAGAFFRSRYTSKLVDSEQYLVWLPHYIHLNPVNDGFAPTPEAWRWSSYRRLVGLSSHWPWLATEAVLGDRTPAEFRAQTEQYRGRVGKYPVVESAKAVHGLWVDLSSGGRSVRVEEIETAVCSAFDVDAVDILDRYTDANAPRTLAMALLLRHSPLTRREIARRYGVQSRDTVTAAARRSELLLADTDVMQRLHNAGLNL